MSLELQKILVHRVTLGEQTLFKAGHLEVCAEDLCRELREADTRIDRVTIETANPGDSTRILCVKDVVEPRLHVSGNKHGQGVVRVLANAAIVTCGPIVGYQEGIIDMSGPGAEYTPFSTRHLLVLQIDVVEGITKHQHEETIRCAGLRAAESLVRAANDAPSNETQIVHWSPSQVDASLPRIAYVCMVLSQGLLHDTFVLGKDAKHGLPAIVDPRIGMTDGVVSGNCVSACDKNTTYYHQNNPVISDLLQAHGTDWNFVGVVITNEPVRLGEKQRSASETIELIRQLNANGAVITKEGFGNPDADLMMIVRGLEQAGIRTTIITDEFAGIDGGSQSLADTTPEADAVVSTGNANQRIVLPAMNRVLGELADAARIAGGYPHSLQEDGSMEVELQAIIGATNQFGIGCLSCREI